MKDRKSRLALNSVFSLLSWLAPIGLGLIVTPIVVRNLGTELYGVYLVILGFFSYSVTFNVGRTVAKFVAEYRSTRDDSRVNETISSAFWLNLLAGLIGAAVMAVASEWIVADILQVSEKFHTAARMALILGAFAIPISQVGQIFQNVLQGVHRFGKVSLIVNLNWLLLNGGNVILVVNGYGLVALLAWNLTATCLISALSFLIARSQDQNFVPGTRTGPMLRSVAAYGSSIFLYQLFGTALLLFERSWLLRNFGPTETAYYLLPMTLAIYLHGLILSLSLAVFPVVNELLEDRERLLLLYKKATKIIVALTVLIVASAVCLGKLFLELWLGPEFAQNGYTNLVFHFLTFGMIAIMIIIWHINEAHGAARLNAGQVFVWAAVSIPLMILTSNIWLAEGMAASRTIGVLATLPIVPYCERRFLGAIQWGLWIGLVLRIGIATVVMVLVEWLIGGALGSSWLSFLVAGSAGTLAFSVGLLVTGFVTSDEKDMLSNLFRRPGMTSNV